MEIGNHILGKRICYREVELEVTCCCDGYVTLTECRNVGGPGDMLIISVVPPMEFTLTEIEFENFMDHQKWIDEYKETPSENNQSVR